MQKIQHPICYIFIWNASSLSFKTAAVRLLLSDFMENDDIYIQIVEDFGNAIDLNAIAENSKFAEDVYNSMRPELKNKLQEFLEGGN